MAHKIIDKSNWFIDKADFEATDNSYEITRFHKVWFELLKINPSIRSLHKLGIDQARQTSNFSDDLIKTYEDFKMEEVFNSPLLFKDWWCKYGQRLFKVYLKEVGRLDIITAVEEGASNIVAKKMCIYGVNSYVDIKRLNNGTDGFMVLAVPLSGNIKAIKKSFDNVVGAVFTDLEKNPTSKAKTPQYKVSSKSQINIVTRLLALLHRSIDLYNVKEQWKKGFDVGIYESGTQGYDYKTLPANNKTTLVQKTSTEVVRAINLLENAAIGKFPCFDPIKSSQLDFKEIFDIRKIMLKNELKLIKHQDKEAYRLKAQKNKENFELQRLSHDSLNKI